MAQQGINFEVLSELQQAEVVAHTRLPNLNKEAHVVHGGIPCPATAVSLKRPATSPATPPTPDTSDDETAEALQLPSSKQSAANSRWHGAGYAERMAVAQLLTNA